MTNTESNSQASSNDTMAQWLRSTREMLGEFADRTYQERAWFGNGPEESSAEEMIAMLLDTALFRHAAKDPALDLTAQQRAACDNFVKMLTGYRPEWPTLHDRDVIDDPEWEKIRAAAAQLLKVLPS